MTLQNFEKARTNMVLSQLQPSGVVSENVMAAYNAVPREMFVPNALRGVSYLDDDIPLGNGRVLMEPLLHALMIQDAQIAHGDKCLDIGGTTGYSAAILAYLGGQVVAVEREERLLQEANNHWAQLGLSDKIMPVIGDHAGGYAAQGAYKVIIINGAVNEIPVPLMAQLADDGALYAVLQPDNTSIGQVIAVRKGVAGHIGSRVLGEGVTSYVPGFAPENGFTF